MSDRSVRRGPQQELRTRATTLSTRRGPQQELRTRATTLSTRRAPRLAPGDRLAPHITRSGRFRRIDPSQGRELPAFSAILSTAGWLWLLVYAFRRAGKSQQTPPAS